MSKLKGGDGNKQGLWRIFAMMKSCISSARRIFQFTLCMKSSIYGLYANCHFLYRSASLLFRLAALDSADQAVFTHDLWNKWLTIKGKHKIRVCPPGLLLTLSHPLIIGMTNYLKFVLDTVMDTFLCRLGRVARHAWITRQTDLLRSIWPPRCGRNWKYHVMQFT